MTASHGVDVTNRDSLVAAAQRVQDEIALVWPEQTPDSLVAGFVQVVRELAS